MGRMVLIIDDRIDVWPSNYLNVIQIQKYLFWPHDNIENFISANPNIRKQQQNNKRIDSMGSILIIPLEPIIKNNNNIWEKTIKIYLIDFFRDLGVYKVHINDEGTMINIWTTRSPDDTKLTKYVTQCNKIKFDSPLHALQRSQISYKVNFNELKRK